NRQRNDRAGDNSRRSVDPGRMPQQPGVRTHRRQERPRVRPRPLSGRLTESTLMNVVILGAGTVGSSIAEMLCRHKHDRKSRRVLFRSRIVSETIEQGTILEDLLIRDECLNNPACEHIVAKNAPASAPAPYPAD